MVIFFKSQTVEREKRVFCLFIVYRSDEMYLTPSFFVLTHSNYCTPYIEFYLLEVNAFARKNAYLTSSNIAALNGIIKKKTEAFNKKFNHYHIPQYNADGD